MADTDKTDLAQLTVQLLSSYLSNNIVPREDLPELIKATRAALSDEAPNPISAEPEHVPAVSVRKSIASPDHILSLIDGKPYKMLKRHLSRHGLTPAQYRERYDLPHNYPMTAKTYSEERRATAARIGLGTRKPGAAPTPIAQSTSADAQVTPSHVPGSSLATDDQAAVITGTSTGTKRGGRKSKAQVEAEAPKKSEGGAPKEKKVAASSKGVSSAKASTAWSPRKPASTKLDAPEGAADIVDDVQQAPMKEAARSARKKPALKADAPSPASKRGGRKPKAAKAQASDQKAEAIAASASQPEAQSAAPSSAKVEKVAPHKGLGKAAPDPVPASPEEVAAEVGQPAKKTRRTLKIKTDL